MAQRWERLLGAVFGDKVPAHNVRSVVDGEVWLDHSALHPQESGPEQCFPDDAGCITGVPEMICKK